MYYEFMAGAGDAPPRPLIARGAAAPRPLT
jgi:hypothetical protein